MPLSKRIIQHKVATSSHPRSDIPHETFLGLSGAAVDRMSDITPNLVLTLTPNDTLRLEGTLTTTAKFEFPITSLISKTLIEDVNQRRLSRELFDVICRSGGGKDADDHKYKMIEGQFVMGVVDLRHCNVGTPTDSPSKPEVHKVLLRPDQDLLVDHFMSSKHVHMSKKSHLSGQHIDDRLLVESLMLKELHPVLALEEDAFDILQCFQPHHLNPNSKLATTPQIPTNDTAQLSHAHSFFNAIKNHKNTQHAISNEPFMGVDTRRAWAKTRGQLASIHIIKSTSLILPNVQRYRIWRTIRYEEPITSEVMHYYSINFLVIEDAPSSPSNMLDHRLQDGD